MSLLSLIQAEALYYPVVAIFKTVVSLLKKPANAAAHVLKARILGTTLAKPRIQLVRV